jgi:hypothetical protein
VRKYKYQLVLIPQEGAIVQTANLTMITARRRLEEHLREAALRYQRYGEGRERLEELQEAYYRWANGAARHSMPARRTERLAA